MHILRTWAGNATGPFARFAHNPLANIRDPSDEFGANGRGALRVMARWLGLRTKVRARGCVSTDQKSCTPDKDVTSEWGRRDSWETHMNHSLPLLSKAGKPACRFPGAGTKRRKRVGTQTPRQLNSSLEVQSGRRRSTQFALEDDVKRMSPISKYVMSRLVIVAMLSLTIVSTWVLTGLGQPTGVGISARSK